MKIWVDDIRPAPKGYVHFKSVNETIDNIEFFISSGFWDADIEVIDLDHDAGAYFVQGGDYIRILDWMEKNKISYPIHIHSMNPVDAQNMRRIIQRNGWKEV